MKFQPIGDAPNCTQRTCDAPPFVKDGRFGACGKKKVGEQCLLDCDDSRLEGSPAYTCGSNGKFTGTGKCVPATCRPPTVPGGTTSCDSLSVVLAGESCTLTCTEDGNLCCENESKEKYERLL